MKVPEKITTLDLLANQQKLEFSTKFGKFYSKPEIKEAADFLNKQIDGLSVGVDVNKSVQKKEYFYVTVQH